MMDMRYGQGGITNIPHYAGGGYVEPYFLGGLLKGIGSIGAGLLGGMALGPLGAALGSGLFTGLSEKNLKKGILSGLTAYVGGKALTDAGKATQSALAEAKNQAANKAGEAAVRSAVVRPGVDLATEYATEFGSNELFKHGIKSLGSREGLNAVAGSLTSPSNIAFVYPQMGNLATDISLEEDERNRPVYIDPYDEELRRSRARFRSRFGEHPYGELGYAKGGYIDPFMIYSGGDPFGLELPLLGREGDEDFTRDEGGRQQEGPGAGDNVPTGGGTGVHPGDGPGTGGEDIYIPPEPGNYDPDDPIGDDGHENTPTDPITGEPLDRGDDVAGGNPPPDRDPPIGSYMRRLWAREIPEGFIPGLMSEYGYFRAGDDPPDRGIEAALEAYGDPGPDPFALGEISAAIDDAALGDYLGSMFGVEGKAEGGQVGDGAQLKERAVQALMGALPYAEATEAIEAFRDTYGQPALQELMQIVMQMRAEQTGQPVKNEGMIQGPGGGLGDQIIADVAGADPVALSSGEFIVPADVVSHLGDGDSGTGAERLQQMMEQVRMEKTGTKEQAPPLSGGLMSLR